MSLPEGWYPVAGDPANTRRFWDGDAFTSAPKAVRGSGRGFLAPAQASRWRLAGPLVRAIAAFVDYLGPPVIFVGFANATGLGLPGPHADEWVGRTNLMVALAGWMLINHVILTGFFGVTMGKILLGLRVVDHRTKSHPPGLVRAIVRQLLLFPGALLTLFMFLFGRRDGIHDVVAGTSVVYA